MQLYWLINRGNITFFKSELLASHNKSIKNVQALSRYYTKNQALELQINYFKFIQQKVNSKKKTNNYTSKKNYEMNDQRVKKEIQSMTISSF